MVIRAYDEEYVSGAQRILGDAVDFAVMSLGLDPVLFGNAFAVSESSKQFAAGNHILPRIHVQCPVYLFSPPEKSRFLPQGSEQMLK